MTTTVPAPPPSRPAVELRAITGDDVGRVGQFLTAHLNPRVPPAAWVRAMTTDLHGVAPNHGYLLEEAGSVVGAYVAYYTQRVIGDVEHAVCNLGAWCVLDTHRFHSVRLLKALLAQRGFDYLDLSPSGNVVGLNKRLGFKSLDTSTALIPNIPWPSWPGRTSISSDPSVIEATLTDEDLAIYRDHATRPPPSTWSSVAGRNTATSFFAVIGARTCHGSHHSYTSAIRTCSSARSGHLPEPCCCVTACLPHLPS